MKRTFGLLAILLVSMPAAAQDAPAVTMTYQGYLTDLARAPVEGTRQVTFRMYTSAEDGEAVWEEAHDEVDVVEGSFTAVLGADETFPGTIEISSARHTPPT